MQFYLTVARKSSGVKRSGYEVLLELFNNNFDQYYC